MAKIALLMCSWILGKWSIGRNGTMLSLQLRYFRNLPLNLKRPVSSFLHNNGFCQGRLSRTTAKVGRYKWATLDHGSRDTASPLVNGMLNLCCVIERQHGCSPDFRHAYQLPIGWNQPISALDRSLYVAILVKYMGSHTDIAIVSMSRSGIHYKLNTQVTLAVKAYTQWY